MLKTLIGCALVLCAIASAQQNTITGYNQIVGQWDASQASRTNVCRQGAGSPNGRDVATRVGECYFQTDAAAGSNNWNATALPSTWSLVSGTDPAGAQYAVQINGGSGALGDSGCTSPTSTNMDCAHFINPGLGYAGFSGSNAFGFSNFITGIELLGGAYINWQDTETPIPVSMLFNPPATWVSPISGQAIVCATGATDSCTLGFANVGSGTITGVTAGTGLSGGGMSGTVTLNANGPISGATTGAIVTASGATTIQTACATCTVSSGGAMSLPGSLSAGAVIAPASASLVTSGLMAEYRFDQGSGTTLTDYSANAYNGTITGSPSWIPGGILFANTPTGSATQWIDLPSALNTAATIIVMANNPGSTLAQNNYTIWGPSVSGGPSLYTVLGGISQGGGNMGMQINYDGHNGTATVDNTIGLHCLVTVLDVTQDKFYIDGNQVSTYYLRGGTAGLQTSGNYRLGMGVTGVGSEGFSGPMYHALFYSSELTAAQIQQSCAYVSSVTAQKGIILNAPSGFQPASQPVASIVDNRLVAIGDSITLGQGGTPYTSQMTLDDTYTIVNDGVGTQFAINTPFNTQYSYISNLSHGLKQACLILIGTNDITQFAAEMVAQGSFNAALACHQAGAKAIIGTMLSRTGEDTLKNTLNALLRQYWPIYADGLCDLAANPLIGADGAYANTTYFQSGGVHPTTTGYGIMGTMWSAAVNSLYGKSTQSGNPNTATGTYSMLSQDLFLMADPSGGSVTVNMVTSVGNTGQIRCIKNIQSIGVNTVTAVPFGSETIDGSASVLVPNTKMACFRAQLVSASAGGSNWQQTQ